MAHTETDKLLAGTGNTAFQVTPLNALGFEEISVMEINVLVLSTASTAIEGLDSSTLAATSGLLGFDSDDLDSAATATGGGCTADFGEAITSGTDGGCGVVALLRSLSSSGALD